MSICYPFSLATTKSVCFAEVLECDEYKPLLLQADSARALVKSTLKEAKDGHVDFLAVIKALEEYMPCLFAMMECLDNGDIGIGVGALEFSWKLPSRSKKRNIMDKVKRASFEFERGMILLTYIMAFMGLAQSAISKTSGDVKWKQATAHMLRAQSAALYLMANPVQFEDIPWDITPNTINMMSNVISGSLHLLVLYKDIEQAVDEYYSIPKTSASMVLMTRVAIFSADKFGSTLQMLDKKETPDSLESWLKDVKIYSLACAQRFMAMQQATKGNIGNAIAYLTAAMDALSTNKMKQALSSSGSGSWQTTSIGEVKQQLKENNAKILHSYKAENDAVAFQPIPKLQDIDEPWPSGRQVVEAKEAFVPPVKSYRDGDRSSRVSSASESYAGKGNYF